MESCIYLSPPVDVGTCDSLRLHHFSIRLGIRKSASIVSFSGHPEPVTEKTLKTVRNVLLSTRTSIGTAHAYETEQEVKNLKRKEVNQMKKSVSLLCNLLLSSTLFWGVPSVEAEELISMVPTDTTAYCHLKFPAMREDSLSWERPVLDSTTGHIVDFYGPCDYDPVGLDEIRVQRRVILRGNFDDGD